MLRQHVAANNLRVIASDKLNHYVTVSGAVADVERATGVRLNRIALNGEVHRVPSGEVAVPGAAAKVVAAVQGLSDLNYQNCRRDRRTLILGSRSPPCRCRTLGRHNNFSAQTAFAARRPRPSSQKGGGPYAVYTGSR